jgi:hypothetical protein
LQRTNIRRRAAEDFCEEMGIPIQEAMAVIDTDYASEPQTCGVETDDAQTTAHRHAKAGLGQTARKLIGPEWRIPDVSEG